MKRSKPRDENTTDDMSSAHLQPKRHAHAHADMTAPTPAPDTAQSQSLPSLLKHCDQNSIFISSAIAARSFPGRGLGVYTTSPVRAGQKLIHVPVKSILTTRNIPESFLSRNVRRKVTVHFALAAFLAFGEEKDVGVFRGWMDTWPSWDEFVEGMPVFWELDFRGVRARLDSGEGTAEIADGETTRANKRRKTIAEADSAKLSTNGVSTEKFQRPSFSRSPGIDGLWLTQRPSSTEPPQTHFDAQAGKIRACIAMLDAHFPSLKIRDPASHESYWRFLHMWACVNTRCFYYLHPGQTAPEDSNEAMALCPFQDLFNHSDKRSLNSMFDKRGFFIHADRDYNEGEELFLRYGRHTNDMLWMEYGFFMDQNKDDEHRIDRAIVRSFGEAERDVLERDVYWGDYCLKKDSVCYRTTVISYLGILTSDQWNRFVAGGLDPETNRKFAMARLKARRRIVEWILLVRGEAEENLKVITNIQAEDQVLDAFGGNAPLTKGRPRSKESRLRMGTRRKEMCIRQWKQVFDTCMTAIRLNEKECPGSFMVEEKEERTEKALQQNANQFVHSMNMLDS